MSGVILDTTVLVDLTRNFASTVAWVSKQPRSTFYVTTVTIGELVKGAYRRAAGSASRLSAEMHQIEHKLLVGLDERVLPFDRTAAERWGEIMGTGEARGRGASPDDAKIAAIALVHGFTVATSNTRDFIDLCPIIDPRTA